MLKLYVVIIIVQNCILFILNLTSERTPNPHTFFINLKQRKDCLLLPVSARQCDHVQNLIMKNCFLNCLVSKKLTDLQCDQHPLR